MTKIIGYVEMTKRVGKIVFVVNDDDNGKVKGMSCDKIFLFEDMSLKVGYDDIGKRIDVMYGRGFNGQAIITDIKIS